MLFRSTGIRHSEFNGSDSDALHLLQIWLLPEQQNLAPGYEEKQLELKSDSLNLLASPDAREGSVRIHQQSDLFRGLVGAGKSVSHALAANRAAYIHVISGSVMVDGMELNAADGFGVHPQAGNHSLEFTASNEADFLLFDMAV